eukprot:5085405-Prorocentrum_lima.AAC.1
MASGMTLLESKIPDGKEIEERLKKIDMSLAENKKDTRNVSRELRHAVEQLDQLEQNLEIHP